MSKDDSCKQGKGKKRKELIPTDEATAFSAVCWRCPNCHKAQISRKSNTHIAECICCDTLVTVKVTAKTEGLEVATV